MSCKLSLRVIGIKLFTRKGLAVKPNGVCNPPECEKLFLCFLLISDGKLCRLSFLISKKLDEIFILNKIKQDSKDVCPLR
jgi:hypothetical protein